MKPTYLYIKQHKITKLKYFGKTIKEPLSYLGSGKHWKRHIKKHGEHVETIWYKLFTDEESLVEYATKFSQQNNIVESKEWANLKEENGLDGGFDKGWWSKEQKQNISLKQKERWANGIYDREKLRLSRIGFKQPESQKKTVAEKLSKEWSVTSPTGEQMVIKNLQRFCRENNLDQGNLSRGTHKGWKAVKIEA